MLRKEKGGIMGWIFPQIKPIEHKLKNIKKNINSRSDVDIKIQYELKGVSLTQKITVFDQSLFVSAFAVSTLLLSVFWL